MRARFEFSRRWIVGLVLVIIGLGLAATFSTRPVLGLDSPGGTIAHGAGTTIVEAGTGPSGGFTPVLTTLAFHAENTGGGVTGSLDCLALAPEDHRAKQVLPVFKPSTCESHRIALHKHLLPYFGEKRLCDIGTADIQTFVTMKAEAGLSWNMVKNLRNLVSRILRTAVEWSLLTSNRLTGCDYLLSSFHVLRK